jgi:hypothetical protein
MTGRNITLKNLLNIKYFLFEINMRILKIFAKCNANIPCRNSAKMIPENQSITENGLYSYNIDEE